MTKRRLIRWSLILAILVAFAVWLEPTRVVWGWLRREAFYDGRPTSYWASELERWGAVFIADDLATGQKTIALGVNPAEHQPPDGAKLFFYRQPGWGERIFKTARGQRMTTYGPGPELLQGDSDAEPVLQALAEHPDRDVRRLALYGLKTIEEKRP